MRQHCPHPLDTIICLVLAAGLAACDSEKSRNPLSPSIAGPIAGVTISSPGGVTPAAGRLIPVGDQPIQVTFDRSASNSERPYWYELQISRDEAFADVMHTATDIPASGNPSETYQLTVTFDSGQVYYWRVRARDGANTGPYSPTASFEVFTPLAVGTPSPVAPGNGTTTGTLETPLVVDNATITGPLLSESYRFDVATDPSFGAVIASLTVPAGEETTTGTTPPLAWDTLYYWRSRAVAQGREGQVDGPWSDVSTFNPGPEPVVVGVPTLVSPINNAEVASNRPTFTVTNGPVTGQAGPITITFHVGTDSTVSTVVARFEASASSSGTTTATSPALPAGATLYWRVFAGDGSTVSAWTDPQSFRTPAAGPTPPDEGDNRVPPPDNPGCCPPPNRFAVVQQVAAETGYPNSGINVTDFTQIVAERLHAEDPNWGRRINITGPIGKDTVAYKVNGSTSNPYSVDIVLGATGSNPRIHWNGHGHIGGTWKTP